ncbi:MAG TPA: TIR domain-containing protein [Xanthobacteraceae bacterium]|jgi:TolB-like protein/lipoprotein NlpI
MSEPNKAVFLSYASQDAEAARRICEAFRAAGIEVWLDQSELRGGDAWDRRIRKQIHDCALVVAVISAHTEVRTEGYFRLEWKLAVDRSHLMAEDAAFLIPVVIDGTSEATARVPDKFREVQWTRLPAGEISSAFVQRVARLLLPEPTRARPEVRSKGAAAPHTADTPPRHSASSPGASRWTQRVPLLIAAIAVIGVAYFAVDKFILSKRPALGAQASVPAAQADTPVPSAIPEKSIAVLPFVNMSSDKEQDYFSDGLTEEMIDLLAKVPDLRVPARTSSFYFKGKSEDIATIAQKLHVTHVLEGSVRKAGKRLRITAELIRADNGYHLWSQAYDRDNSDVFAVQDDIAKAVVSVLQVKLAEGLRETGSRGTSNTEAYNQYLLGRQIARRSSLEGSRRAVEAYGKAIALDPNYAAAYAGLAKSEAVVADITGDTVGIERARHDVDKAISLAPNDAIGYSARGYIRMSWFWDWSGAQADIDKALLLDPRNSEVQGGYGLFLLFLDRLPEAIAAQKKAAELDPLSSLPLENLGYVYAASGDYAAAAAALGRAIEIEPTAVFALNNLATLRLLQGRAQEALEVFRKIDFDVFRLLGTAMAEHTLKSPKASQQALDEVIAKDAQDAAYQIAEVFAWRGESTKAFEWLERAYSQRDAGLVTVKADPLLKSLHADPRFDALLRKLKLPE